MAELIDPNHVRRDLREVESAIRKGFEIPDVIYQRTAHVVGKLLNEGKAREKLAAARVLIAMAEFNEGLNQKQQQPQTTVNVGVKIDNTSNAGRTLASEIAERIRAERLLGGSSG
jgi:hypothetical protein